MSLRLLMSIVLLPAIFLIARSAPPALAPTPRIVATAVIESSLATAGGQIRQFAFDSDPNTYFASEANAAKTDHFTLQFDQPVKLESIAILSGRPTGGDELTTGGVEYSDDGKVFKPIGSFASGKVTAAAGNRMVQAIRIRPTENLSHPLVIREIIIHSMPKVVAFRYPIEFTLDVMDAPELREWGEKAIRICEAKYPMICTELASEGYSPPTRIQLSLKSNYNGVAAAGGGKITGSVKYYKTHPDDFGSMVHETVHCVQNYRGRNLPGWLVEGIADYIRFWKYEPGKAGRLNPERARFDGSYRTTAAFLAFVSDKYDKHLVTKLNALLRERKYDPAIWKVLTGKTLEELNLEWRTSLVG